MKKIKLYESYPDRLPVTGKMSHHVQKCSRWENKYTVINNDEIWRENTRNEAFLETKRAKEIYLKEDPDFNLQTVSREYQ